MFRDLIPEALLLIIELEMSVRERGELREICLDKIMCWLNVGFRRRRHDSDIMREGRLQKTKVEMKGERKMKFIA
jgi:hypothetical protein